ncbi:MAG: hypothetical protein ACLFUI_09865, partial [Halanaerobiales bacterium]
QAMNYGADKTITLRGVNRFSQAGREAKYFQKKSKYCTTMIQFKAGIDSIQCEVGDVVLITHERPEWTDKPFRIAEIVEEENDEMQITAVEYNEAVFVDDGTVYQPSTGSSLPNPFEKPPGVTDLSLIEEANVLDDGSWIPQIKITYERPKNMFWKYANIYISDDDGASWEKVTKTESTSHVIKEVASDTYKIKVQSENRSGIKEDFGEAITGQITVGGKDSPPGNVDWGDCEFQEIITLRWQSVNDLDLRGYEVRTDTNFGNDDSALIYRGDGLKTTIDNPKQRQYTFYIKALDRSGNYSDEASEITLLNSAPSAPNFSDEDITEFFSAIRIRIPQVSSATGYKLYITPSDGEGNSTGDTEVIPFSSAQTTTYNVSSGDSVLIKIGSYDNLTSIMDDENISDEYEATAATLDDIAEFAADLRPPLIVETKPELPDQQFGEGSTIVYNGRLFVNEGDEWVSKVDEADLAVDALMAATVEAGAIGVDELASAEAIIEKLGTNELITNQAQIRDAIIDNAKILNVDANKIISNEVFADLFVTRGSMKFEGQEKESVESLAVMGLGVQEDEQITNSWTSRESDSQGDRYYNSAGQKTLEITNTGDYISDQLQIIDNEATFSGILAYDQVIDLSVQNQDLPEPTIIDYGSTIEGFWIVLEKPSGDYLPAGGWRTWDGFKIYADKSSNPSSSEDNLVAAGKTTRFEVTGLDPDTEYYVEAVMIDINGNESPAAY